MIIDIRFFDWNKEIIVSKPATLRQVLSHTLERWKHDEDLLRHHMPINYSAYAGNDCVRLLDNWKIVEMI